LETLGLDWIGFDEEELSCRERGYVSSGSEMMGTE